MPHKVKGKDILDDCPCKNCLVRATYQEACIKEVIWFKNLGLIELGQYGRSKLFKRNTSKEAHLQYIENIKGKKHIVEKVIFGM